MLSARQELRHSHQLVTSRSLCRGDMQHRLYHGVEVFRVVLRQPVVLTFQNRLEQPLHVFGLEGRFERDHLVNDAAQGPDVALKVIWFISPDLRTRIVRSTRLSIVETVLIG